MAIYTVHAPRMAGGGEADPTALVFVKDGFCWPALFIPVVWLAWRGLWLALLLYLVLAVALGALSGVAGPGPSSAVMVLFAFWFALEANGLRRWTLDRRGFALVGVVEGRTRQEAERRWFGEVGDMPAPAAAAPVPTPVASPAPPRRSHGVTGLFPAPGGRA